MTANKKDHLVSRLGGNMAESAGSRITSEDRYRGFIPTEVATGEMAIDRIMEDVDQPRKTFDEQALQDFAEHLKNHGIQQPIQLRWNEKHQKWLIVYGHRRFRAAKLAGFETIPCTFSDEDIDESTIRIRQLVENCQREDLAAMEMARALEALCNITGWSNRRIGEELGFNHTTIGRYRDLLKLPEDLQQRVNRGELAASVAVDVLRLKNATEQRQIGREIVEQKLSRSQAKQRIDQILTPGAIVVQQHRPSRPHELLVETNNITIYRNPDVSNDDIQSELITITAQLNLA